MTTTTESIVARFGPERAARAEGDPAYRAALERQLILEESNRERWSTDDRYRQQCIEDDDYAALDEEDDDAAPDMD